MLKKIHERVLFVLLTLFGIFMIYGEVVIRLFRGTKYAGEAYDIYYLMPIRAHGFVAKISFWFLLYLLIGIINKERTIPKIILLVIYAIYLLLFFGTLRSM